MPLNKRRDELPWLYYPKANRVIINAHNFPSGFDLTGLESHWKLDEASGNATDAHGSNTLTQTGTVTSEAGKIGTARRFDGAGDYFSLANNASLQVGDIDFTLALWTYPVANPVTNSRGIISKWGAAGQRSYLLAHIVSTNVLSWVVSADGTATAASVTSSIGALSLNTWYYIVVWHDATNNVVGISVNGTEDTVGHSGGVHAGTNAFNIGTFNSSGSLVTNSRIDEVSYWKRMLTSGERAALYNSGSGKAYPFT